MIVPPADVGRQQRRRDPSDLPPSVVEAQAHPRRPGAVGEDFVAEPAFPDEHGCRAQWSSSDMKVRACLPAHRRDARRRGHHQWQARVFQSQDPRTGEARLRKSSPTARCGGGCARCALRRASGRLPRGCRASACPAAPDRTPGLARTPRHGDPAAASAPANTLARVGRSFSDP